MEINNKYNIDEAVFYLKSNRVEYARIRGISVTMGKCVNSFGSDKKPSIRYHFEEEIKFESEVFKTKEELLKTL